MLALLAVVSCGDEDYGVPIVPEGVGWVEGSLTGAYGPVTGVVELAREPSGAWLRQSTGPDGRFSLEVPYGRYAVSIEPSAVDPVNYGTGLPPHPDTPEEIVIDADHRAHRVDLRYGALRMEVELDGLSFPLACGLGVGARGRASWSVNRWRPVTAQNGTVSWTLDGVPPGVYSLALNLDPLERDWVMLGSTEFYADTFHVAAGQARDCDGWAPAPARVTGRIRGAIESAPQGCDTSIGLFDVTGRPLGFTWVTPQGNYSLDVLWPRPVRVLVESEARRRWIGGASPDSATVFPLPAGAVVRLPDVVAGGLACRLTWAQPGGRVNGTVEVHDPLGTVVASARIDGDLAIVCGLDPGVYTLWLNAAGCEDGSSPQWYPGVPRPEQALPVEITAAGELVQVDWSLVTGNVLSGAIDGVPDGMRPDILLYRYTPEPGYSCQQAAGADGAEFRFQGLRDGDYLVAVAVWDGGVRKEWWYPGSWSAEEARVISCRDFVPVEGVRWGWPR